MKESVDTPKIGLALGSGASRGWSHIGVIKALLREGIEPDIVCGTSVGAMVGGSYVAGNLDKLEQWVLGSSRTDVLSFFSIRMPQTAFVDIDRLNWFLDNFVAAADTRIEDLQLPYAAICTDFDNGREVMLSEGDMADAVRASMAMPGLFPAVRIGEQWLIDGGLVDPVPVAACRTLGADVVIGVNLNSDILHRHKSVKPVAAKPQDETFLGDLKQQTKKFSNLLTEDRNDPDKAPGLIDSISRSINIFQHQITRSRLDTDPADVMISPKVGDIGMLEFRRAADAIKEGQAKTREAVGEIRERIQSGHS